MKLDIGCSDKKQKGFIGLDNRYVEGVDIVHDIHEIPWPLPHNSCSEIRASHVLEHIKPWKFFDIVNEAWRICEPGGKFEIRVPVGLAFKVDPSHTIEFSPWSFWYLDPEQDLYRVYKPSPWSIIENEINNELELVTILQKKEQ